MNPAPPPQTPYARISSALPFWLSLGMVPMAAFGMVFGGWATALLPLYSWALFMLLDALTGLNPDNADPQTPEAQIFGHKLITLIWFPVQALILVAMLVYVPQADHLGTGEKIALFFGMGAASCTDMRMNRGLPAGQSARIACTISSGRRVRLSKEPP